MRGLAAGAQLSPGLAGVACEVLDRRLIRQTAAPVAVALSGGGDSLALLHVARDWAKARGRRLLALTVDHGLNPASPRWTAACAAAARRLDVDFQALAWTGEKPTAGLPAAARDARHRLLADAARAAGARVILMGHTADDVLEARAMRAAGSTTPDPYEWAPSPAWPEGRGLFLLRPLMGVRRADLRAWLRGRGLEWIDDPANSDLRFARARARAGLQGEAVPPPQAPRLPLAEAAQEAATMISLPLDAWRAAAGSEAERFLAIACVCAGGAARRPAGARVARLAERLRTAGPLTATLAGARVACDGETIRICREAGEAARGGLPDLQLPPRTPIVWDGRVILCADRTGVRVRRLAGMSARLPPEQARALAALPPDARGGLPAIARPGDAVASPLLGRVEGVEAESLVGGRLLAACGLVSREPG